ncbi:aminoglycoside phosphotransferase family protein [Actinoplanes bogorensis]|uniref:Aminoglycoside phosphotransferase family protein n=1 Tax=Paractinoplanes bogorensis TaxID=1610840 RepID=A0ABS5YND2_9ACTN|nr:phosphotransferase [Actinoplanes bogorensis]MBU2664883.1 aminoglycoside phosphotransferase family protein [Actinoplanes bogorensis]
MTPPVAVLQAFGATGPVRPLAGGQGTSWRAGDLVLKPEPGGPPLDVVEDGFRLARPHPAGDGAWTVDGWSATRWVPGAEPDPAAASTWRTVIEAGRAFHRATAQLAPPPAGDGRWAVADRIAWSEVPPRWLPEFAPIAARLGRVLEPLGPPQFVHCDLTRNVLVAEGLSPAIIDVSPYWRPTAYAEGVVIADALSWHEAGPWLLAEVGVSVPAVARALLFRMATDTGPEWAGRYEKAATAIGV